MQISDDPRIAAANYYDAFVRYLAETYFNLYRLMKKSGREFFAASVTFPDEYLEFCRDIPPPSLLIDGVSLQTFVHYQVNEAIDATLSHQIERMLFEYDVALSRRMTVFAIKIPIVRMNESGHARRFEFMQPFAVVISIQPKDKPTGPSDSQSPAQPV